MLIRNNIKSPERKQTYYLLSKEVHECLEIRNTRNKSTDEMFNISQNSFGAFF